MVCCNQNPKKECFKTNALLLATTLGIILGIALGIAMREANLSSLQISYFAFPGEILLRMLKMVILPLVTTSIITGVSNLDRSVSGKLGLRAIAYHIGTTFIAVVLGIILVVFIQPGKSGKKDIDPIGSTKSLEPLDAILDLLRNLFPENLVQACFQQYETKRIPIFEKNTTEVMSYSLEGTYKSGTSLLGLIFFCFIFGIITGKMGNEGKNLVMFFSSANEVIMKIVTLVTWYAPFGIVFLIASQLMKMENPEEVIRPLGLYMSTVLAGLSIHGLLILPLIYFLIVRKNPFVYAMGFLQAFLTALATASSSATLPIAINCLETKNKVDKRVARFMLPIGSIISLNGTAFYEAVAAVFIAQINGINLNFGQVVALSLTATFASVGAAGIPQGGLVTLIIVLSSVGLPTEDISLIITIDWLLDRFRTSINVLSNCFGAGIVEKLSKDDLRTLDVRDEIENYENNDLAGLDNEAYDKKEQSVV